MFERQYESLQDHNTRRREATKDFDNVLDWNMHIRDIPHDFPLMDKIQTKKIEVTIETCESICDIV